MITARLTVTVHQGRLREELGRQSLKFIDRVTDAIAIRSRELAPNRSGDLRRSIKAQNARMTTPTRATGRVIALASYAVYVHEGTGIYGPRRRRIVPRHAKALRFRWDKAGNRTVFFRSVAGMKPTKFMTQAVDDLLSSPPWRIVYLTAISP